MQPSCKNLRNDRILVVQLNKLSVMNGLWVVPLCKGWRELKGEVFSAFRLEFNNCSHE
jgi:hypothetical protein